MTNKIEFSMPSEKNFGITFSIFFLLAFLFLLLNGHIIFWILIISLIFLFFAFFFSSVLKYPNYFWFRLGKLLSHIINPIIMFLLYFLIFIPYGLLLKIFRKDKKNWHIYDNEQKFEDQF